MPKEFKSKKYFEAMRKMRMDLHQIPELGFKEIETSQFVFKILTELGIKVHPGIGKTGLVGVLKKGNSSKAIGLRAELDALLIEEENNFSHRSKNKGCMHACGHDGHMSMLLGTANYLANESNFNGTVYFIFQPDEEHGCGAKAMINDHIFDRFPMDMIFALHNMPSIKAGTLAIKSGPVMASEDNFEIKINGSGCHAAMPHLGIDPILVGAQVVQSLQSIVSRSLNPSENAVLSVTEFNSNGSTNIIGSSVIIKGDCRAYSSENQELFKNKITRMTQGICEAMGASCNIDYHFNFTPTINEDEATLFAKKTAQSAPQFDEILEEFDPYMTSEDFGWMLKQKKGCYVLLGSAKNGTNPALHNPKFDFNDEILCTGSDFFIEIVEKYLN